MKRLIKKLKKKLKKFLYMNIKQEKDTYGSKLRNLLSPFYNIVVLTKMDNEEKILNFLFGMLIIFCIQYLCIFILKILNITFPAPILGIIVLFILLKLDIIKENWIEDFCNFILKYMILFFIPMFVGIVNTL
jgi:hypothetical protein